VRDERIEARGWRREVRGGRIEARWCCGVAVLLCCSQKDGAAVEGGGWRLEVRGQRLKERGQRLKGRGWRQDGVAAIWSCGPPRGQAKVKAKVEKEMVLRLG
jgi:hypothetical protein